MILSRPQRIWYEGATYHITARGNRRAALFQHRSDYDMYVAILEDIRMMFPFILHAYCLMTNHIHLLIETKHHHIKDIMKEWHSRYAVYFNRKYHFDGHVFQGRYSAKMIDTDAYFLQVSRYIHRNPLEAKMVSNLTHYEWSSYIAYNYECIQSTCYDLANVALFPSSM
ncbi:transposase [Bacillus salinus]|uniref:transposase n=1 Tax=Bacillus sp. HMF5848 TaxID=2495421 RepID=UPI0021ADDF49|nr:transposase [Bacillus sp. HMF5848]